MNAIVKILLTYVLLSSCGEKDIINFNELRSEVIISNNVFTVSYNEIFEQPNWVKYTVRDIEKKFDRGSLDFYTEKNIHTSDNNDYYKNEWDKGHLAPAASFSDTYNNLYQTFSFLNCALQYDNLNRYEWAQLESKVRDWAKEKGDIEVLITLEFDENHIILDTGAHVPTAFIKQLKFVDNSLDCYYFKNEPPQFNWDQYQVKCN